MHKDKAILGPDQDLDWWSTYFSVKVRQIFAKFREVKNSKEKSDQVSSCKHHTWHTCCWLHKMFCLWALCPSLTYPPILQTQTLQMLDPWHIYPLHKHLWFSPNRCWISGIWDGNCHGERHSPGGPAICACGGLQPFMFERDICTS